MFIKQIYNVYYKFDEQEQEHDELMITLKTECQFRISRENLFFQLQTKLELWKKNRELLIYVWWYILNYFLRLFWICNIFRFLITDVWTKFLELFIFNLARLDWIFKRDFPGKCLLQQIQPWIITLISPILMKSLISKAVYWLLLWSAQFIRAYLLQRLAAFKSMMLKPTWNRKQIKIACMSGSLLNNNVIAVLRLFGEEEKVRCVIFVFHCPKKQRMVGLGWMNSAYV